MMRLIAALSLVAALAVVIPRASASARTPIDDAAVTITVVVIDDLVPKAVPFTDFEVVRADGQGESRRIRTDDKGVVTTSLPAGAYHIRSLRAVSFKGKELTWDREIAVEAGKPLALTLTDADAIERESRPLSQTPKPHANRVDTIAVLPWAMTNGTDGAKRTGRDFLAQTLPRMNLEPIPEARTLAAWNEVAKSDYPTEGPLPSATQLLEVGRRLGVDYVMAGSASWHSRAIWISLGPKTKSTCTVSVRVVDVARQAVPLDVKALKMDSTAKEDTLKALGTVFVTALFTVVSGGPKTPHEQRAVQLALAKALDPWAAERMSAKKIAPAGAEPAPSRKP